MLDCLTVRTFKSLEDVTVDLGLVNVFVGANGSGKSNLLEALGVLSAAADGKVDDQSLLSRGVRPGVPRLYKSAFPAKSGRRIPPHLFLGARGARATYEVSLHNPLDDPAPAWRFKTELWEDDDRKLVGRSPATASRANPERGMAALKAVDVWGGDALDLLKSLQHYVIFSPTTPVLRGASEAQPRQPLGLSGGNLPRATQELLKQRKRDQHCQRICRDVLDPERQLGALPKRRRFAKAVRDYRGKQDVMTAAWPAASANLAEAARFEREFLAALVTD